MRTKIVAIVLFLGLTSLSLAPTPAQAIEPVGAANPELPPATERVSVWLSTMLSELRSLIAEAPKLTETMAQEPVPAKEEGPPLEESNWIIDPVG